MVDEDAAQERYEVERRGDGWVVVTASGDVVSEHDLEASAIAERTRLVERDPGGDSPGGIGARPDQSGG